MNWLFVDPVELTDSGSIEISGKRARYVHEWHKPSLGAKLKGLIGSQERVQLEVVELSPSQITLRILEPLPGTPRRLPVSLCVAVPRPQTAKKVLQTAAMFGVQELQFFPSYSAPKSYLQSSLLRGPAIQAELVKGLEQVGDPVAPEVSIFQTQEGFFERSGLTARTNEAAKFIAAPASGNPSAVKELVTPCVIAVGPEAGWGEQEYDRFENAGFRPFSLGERAVRVETALAALLGVLSLSS